jgi:hypothetical protein
MNCVPKCTMEGDIHAVIYPIDNWQKFSSRRHWLHVTFESIWPEVVHRYYACSTWPDYCYSIQIHGSPSIVSIAFMALLRWNRKYAREIGGKRLFEGNGRDTRWIVSDFVRAMNEANRVKLARVSGWYYKDSLSNVISM